MTQLTNARILIVDDQEPNVMLLQRLLEHAGYRTIQTTTDARQALPLYVGFQPDIVLLDLMMPHIDGFGVMAQLRSRLQPDEYMPILVLTADITEETKQQALSQGARDFLTKPFDATEVVLRIKNLLETRALHVQLQQYNRTLEDRVRERTAELEQTRVEVIERLALAAEYRDDDTRFHTQRVGTMAGELSKLLGFNDEDVELIRRTAPLHDLGKIGIPDGILLKPGKLEPEEFERIKTHVTIGATILSGSRFRLLQMAEEIALTHHERWDGTGYAGLSGEGIPRPGRVVAIVDVFDALTHERPYKRAWSMDEALTEIATQRGRHFDPEVYDAFMTMDHKVFM
jgi:putative two-component system response regulator